AVRIVPLGKKGELAFDQQPLPDVWGWVRILVPHPVKSVIETSNCCQMIKDRVTFAAVSGDDPHPTAPGILEKRPEKPRVLLALLLRVHEHKSGALPVEAKDGLVGNVSRLEKLRRCKVVNGREFAEQRASAHHEQIEI